MSETELKNPAPVERLLTRSFLRIFAVQVSFNLSVSVFFLLPKYLVNELDASAREIGIVNALAPIASLLVVPFLGSALDKAGPKRFIQIGALIATFSALCFGSVDSVGPIMYFLRLLQGVAFALAFNATVSSAVDAAPKARTAEAIGLIGAGSLVTNAIGPTLAEVFSQEFGWNAVFLGGAGSAFLSFMLTRNLPVAPQRRESHAPVTPNTGFWSVRLMGVLVSAAAMGMAFGTMITFYQPLALQIGITDLRSFFVAYTLAAIGIRLVMGNIADRVGRRRIGAFALGLYAVAVYAMSHLEPGMLAIIGVIQGLSHGLGYPSLNALTLDRAPADARGRAMTYFNGAFNAGFALSVGAFGLVAEHYGYRSVFVLSSALVLLSIGFLFLGTAGNKALGKQHRSR